MLTLAFPCLPARADGPADLRAALARLAGPATVKGDLDVQTQERYGEGREAIEKTGRVVLDVEQGPRGLQVSLPADALARLEAETRARGRDPDARTPTMQALKRLDTASIAPMLSAATTLAAELETASFKGERMEAWRGRQARVLTYTLPMSGLDELQRKYFRQYDGTLEIWIANDGTPLASATHASLTGRAFVVVGFDGRDDDDSLYGVQGDRLVTLRSETHGLRGGAGERLELRVVKTLTPD
jgi:hypothetical protein